MEEINKNRVLWQARRGMLELDLLLEPFVRDHFDTLDCNQQQLLHELLACEDQDLYAWLMQRQVMPDTRFDALISAILANSE